MLNCIVFTFFFPFTCSFSGIHQEAPEFVEMSVQQEILETGIKVVDLLAPYAKGGKIGKAYLISLELEFIKLFL